MSVLGVFALLVAALNASLVLLAILDATQASDIGFASTTLSVKEDAHTATLEVVRSDASAPLELTFSTSDGSASGVSGTNGKKHLK